MHIFRAVVAAAFIASVTACTSSTINTPPGPSTSQGSSPLGSIKHVVILFQENRSMNTIFMGFPGATTASSGACKPWNPPPQYDEPEVCPKGGPVKLKPILLEANGQIGGADIEHEHSTFEAEYDHGKMDGFGEDYNGTLGTNGPAREYPYSYIVRREVQPYWDMASQYTLADKMFSTETSDSFPAHQMIIAGTTSLNSNEALMNEPQSLIWGCDAPPGTLTGVLYKNGKYNPFAVFPCFDQYKTMADSLDAANVSWNYYVENWNKNGPFADFSGGTWNGFDAIKKVRYGPDWKKHIVMPNSTVLTDAAKGTLPAVSWVIPKLVDSDHPASGCGNGPNWVSQVVDAIGKGPDWNSTAIIITWDEWGGWYDPVPPPQLDYISLGMRIPMIIISPYSKHHYVSETQYEFGSILKYIEQNFNAPSLGATDVRANSIGDVFDFTQKPYAFKPIPIPKAMPCSDASPEEVEKADGGVPD